MKSSSHQKAVKGIIERKFKPFNDSFSNAGSCSYDTVMQPSYHTEGSDTRNDGEAEETSLGKHQV